jgi:hypothetical protein
VDERLDDLFVEVDDQMDDVVGAGMAPVMRHLWPIVDGHLDGAVQAAEDLAQEVGHG